MVNVTCNVLSLPCLHFVQRQGLDTLNISRGSVVICSTHPTARSLFRTHQPDHSDVATRNQEWHCICGDVSELVPSNAPEPLGEFVTLTHCVDANLMHDVTTGCSVVVCLHFINATPIDWHSKKQTTIETTTCGLEFVAAHTCVEQMIDL